MSSCSSSTTGAHAILIQEGRDLLEVLDDRQGVARRSSPTTILCLPTTPFPAPKRNLPITETDPLRDRISCLAAHGGLAGFPQVSIPGATVDGAPVGLSILGARGSDATLVAVASALERNA